MNKFSILIPTWNNLEMLKLCVRSIEQNSTFEHQILIYVNDGSDGTLQWVQDRGLQYLHSRCNVGVCLALNALRSLVDTPYIAYANDDMYVLPDWDLYLWREIESRSDNMFFLSSTLIQPRPFYCKSVIAPCDFGQSVASFREQDLLDQYTKFEHSDWYGATWPLNVVHRDLWDLVGGYSIDFSPGMYSDPDFSAKLYMVGVRYFRGVSASRVYHFEASSTARVEKNKGSRQFLAKWGITSNSFVTNILRRGQRVDDLKPSASVDVAGLRRSLMRSRFKRFVTSAKDVGTATNLYEI
ncbi:MAG: glycosyltransferase family 2 protein [Mucinivorans sp.]